MKPSSIKTQFGAGDFQVIREAAARAGLPIRHWAQRILVAEARRADADPVTPQAYTGSPTRVLHIPGEQSEQKE